VAPTLCQDPVVVLLFLVSCVGGVVAASLAQPVPARERCHGKQWSPRSRWRPVPPPRGALHSSW